MFRQMRRFKQQLADEDCKKLLREEPRGILSLLGDDDYPYGIPMNFYYDEEESVIYFHGAKEGHKVDAIKKHDKVSFCVYDKRFKKPGEWALNIKSVIVFGRMSFIQDEALSVEKCRILGQKYNPSAEAVEEELKNALPRLQMFALHIEHISGKIVNES